MHGAWRSLRIPRVYLRTVAMRSSSVPSSCSPALSSIISGIFDEWVSPFEAGGVLLPLENSRG